MSRPLDQSAAPGPRAGIPECVAFLLCGGLGTRLRSITDRPKAVIDVAGWPFLRYQLEALRGARFERIVFLAGHGAEEVERTFGPATAERIFVPEERPLGTAGALAHARHLAGRTNWIANADSFADVEPAKLLAARGRDDALILAVEVADRSDYGGLRIDDRGMVIGFEEKGSHGPGPINGGIYLLPEALLDECPEGPSSLERDLFPRWAREGRLRAHRADVFFRDIGTPERLAAAQDEFVGIRGRFEAGRERR
jgi:D-glycero-alpha-D-manno-heptose 1-phosphate guanylyltransferase